MAELTQEKVLELSIDALDNSQEGIGEFIQAFDKCALEFSNGNDVQGVEYLKQILEPLRKFSNFCGTLVGFYASELSVESGKSLTEKCATFYDIMENLMKEMESGNFIEIGDILKYDFGDLLYDFSMLFPKVSQELQEKGIIK